MVCREHLQSALAEDIRSLDDRLISHPVVPHIPDKREEPSAVFPEIPVIYHPHALGHLMECLRILQGGGLFHQGGYIVVDVDNPLPVPVAAPVCRDYPVFVVIDDDFLAVYPDGHVFPGQSLGYGIAVVLKADSRLFVHLALRHLEASEFSGIRLQSVQFLRNPVGLAYGQGTALLIIYLHANHCQPLLCLFHAAEVHTCGKGPAADIIHAAFDIPFLPTGAGIAVPEVEPVEGAQSRQGFRGTLFLVVKDDGHAHVVIHHRPGDTVHLPEEVPVGFHERQSVLAVEQVSEPAFTEWKGEHGHHQALLFPGYEQLDFSPVKLALLAGLVADAQINILNTGRLGLFLPLNITAYCGITDFHPLVHKLPIDVFFLQALLMHTGCHTAPVFF